MERFSGDKAEYATWSANMISSLTALGLVEFIRNDWRPAAKPAPPQVWNEQTRTEYAAELSDNIRSNREKQEKKIRTFGHLRQNVADHIHPQLDRVEGEPFLAWELLSHQFGYNAMDPFDRTRVRERIRRLIMKEDDNFDVWLQRFTKECDVLQLKAEERGDIIELDTLLPERLVPHWDNGRARKLSYKAIVDELRSYDQQQRDRRDKDRVQALPNPTGKVKSVNRLKPDHSTKRAKSTTTASATATVEQDRPITCLNCGNVGHFSKECKAPFCGWCKQVDAGHSSNGCPNRQKRGKVKCSDTKSDAAGCQQSSSPYTTKEPYNLRHKKQRIFQVRSNRDPLANSSIPLSMKLDTGAAVSVTPFLSDLDVVDQHFEEPQPLLRSATNEPIYVEAIGSIGQLGEVHVCPSISERLLSPVELQRRGYTIVLPPTVEGGPACTIQDKEGNIIMEGDGNYVLRYSNNNSIDYISNKFDNKIANVVTFTHEVLAHPCQSTLLQLAGSDAILDFPVTPPQVRKAWVTCLACLKGKMKKANFKRKSKTVVVTTTNDMDDTPNKQSSLLAIDVNEGVINDNQQTRSPSPSLLVDSCSPAGGFNDTAIVAAIAQDAVAAAPRQTVGAVNESIVAAVDHFNSFSSVTTSAPMVDAMDTPDAETATLRRSDTITSSTVHRPQLDGSSAVVADDDTPGSNLKDDGGTSKWCSDVLGPLVQSKAGRKYLISFTNQDTGYIQAYLLEYKDQVYEAIQLFLAWLKAINRPARILQTDSESVYTSKAVSRLLMTAGVAHQVSAPHHHEQNGVAERSHRTIGETLVTLFAAAPWVPLSLWEYGVKYLLHAWNQIPNFHRTTLSPKELLLGKKPNFLADNLGPFGFPAEVLVVKENRDGKFSNHSETMVFLGTDTRGKKLGLFYNMNTKVVTSALSFYIHRFLPPQWDISYGTPLLIEHVVDRTPSITQVASEINCTPSLREALQSPQAEDWKAAMKAEEEQFLLMGVYELVDDYPSGVTPVNTHFVLKATRDADGHIVKYKARLVANGKHQSPTTFEEISSPTAKSSTVTLLIAVAAALRLTVEAYDVPAAYLQARTADATSTKGDPNIYIRLPSGAFAKLKKFLYGLKQSGREWYEVHRRFLLDMDYTQSNHDPCLFVWRDVNKQQRHYVLIYVDDDLSIASHPEIHQQYYSRLCERFGNVKRKHGPQITFLGRKITLDANSYQISLPGYINGVTKEYEHLLSHYRRMDLPSQPTPRDTIPCTEVNQQRYLRLLGALTFIAGVCRFDILAAVNFAATKAAHPTTHDWDGLLRIAAYLRDTSTLGISFHFNSAVELRVEADASFNPPQSNGRSRTGFCLSIGNGAAFHASSSHQKLVALSSTEAEYIAIHEATLEVIHFRKLLRELGLHQNRPTVIFNDNVSAIAWTRGNQSFKSTRHIDLRMHHTRLLIQQSTIEVKYKRTEELVADLLTKHLPIAIFRRHRKSLMFSNE